MVAEVIKGHNTHFRATIFCAWLHPVNASRAARPLGKINNLYCVVRFFQIAGIGDLVFASSSLRALRNSYPDAELHLLTSAEAVFLPASGDLPPLRK